MKVIYMQNTNKNKYDVALSLIDDEKTFETHITKFTTIFKVGQKRIILNEKGRADIDALKLINKVRSDAKKYIKGRTDCALPPAHIHWYYYNDFAGFEKPQGDVIKLDIDSAYWSSAVKSDILSNNTTDTFEDMTKKVDKKDKKKMRLKALGSLATIKQILKYEKGKLISNVTQPSNAEFRNLYLIICQNVGELMFELTTKNNLLYHYWDCAFIQTQKQLIGVKDMLKQKEFDFKIEMDFYEILKSEYINSLYSKAKNHHYPIDKAHILFTN